MKLQISCIQTSETTEKTWTENLFVKYNKECINKNPLAYQNKWMSEYYSEHVPEPIMADVLRLKDVNKSELFEEVVVQKYKKATEKDSTDPNIDVDVAPEVNLEDFVALPNPIRCMKAYFLKMPSECLDAFTEFALPQISAPAIPGPIAFMLGVLHDSGLKVKLDHNKALEFYKKAKKGKYPYSYYTLFEIYSRCFGTYNIKQDQEKALRQIVKLLVYCIYSTDSWIAHKIIGDGICGFLNIGYIHLDVYEYTCKYVKELLARNKPGPLSVSKKLVLQNLISVEKKDIEDTFKAMETEAELNLEPFLTSKVADVYISGMGGAAKNLEKSKQLLVKLFDKKEENCFSRYSSEIVGFLHDSKGEYIKAQECYKKSMEYGLAYSFKRMGIAYAAGLEIEKNVALSEKLILTAASLGSTDAYLVLLEMCVYFPEFRPRAIHFLDAIAPLLPFFSQFEQDCFQLYKGIAFEKGYGGPINYPNAITIFSTLPKKDFPVALYRLGKIYEKTNNMIQAQQYYEDCYNNYMDIVKTWTQPHASTCIRIAKLHLKGKGCDKNVHKAKEYYEKAVAIKCCATIPCLMRKEKAVKRLINFAEHKE